VYIQLLYITTVHETVLSLLYELFFLGVLVGAYMYRVIEKNRKTAIMKQSHSSSIAHFKYARMYNR